jgi:hypothetical protein
MTTACTGADAVTAQAWETLAWLLSPPVVACLACVALIGAVGSIPMLAPFIAPWLSRAIATNKE